MKRNPTAFLKEEYQELVDNGFNWNLRELQGPSTPKCIVDGKEMIMLCSNNYLNLSNHPKLINAAIQATKSHGAGSGSVRAIAGSMDLHFQLEDAIARFKKTEASLYYQTGFATNAGLISQLAPNKDDLIISDELNHGSIIDGVRLSKAQRAVYSHCNMGELENILQKKESINARRILIVTDGVFSMDGDIAPMDEIVKLAGEYRALTYCDDCHGEGVIGKDGRGIGSHYSIEGKIDVEMGTFSKGFGVVGGMIAGSQDLVNFAYNKSRTWLLSGSAPPATTAACKAAIEVLETEPQHVETLWKNVKYFKKGLDTIGFDTGHSETAITPVIVGESHTAKSLSDALMKSGIFALPIVFPMVARDKARIRTMMNAGLTREHLETALEQFEKQGKKLHIV